MSIFSCDTMVAVGNSTLSGNVIFAKNSDRPITEAQPLVQYPACDYAAGETVRCTYIEIPQSRHTYKVLGSKPYWIWGFEHGMNEKGVVIGNEAVWAREEANSEKALLGMDLLRLGLERGATAKEALDVITSLLKEYGQGGNAAIDMPHCYHNSFLIADLEEAWVLDTCGKRWVARRVKDVAGISNCYSTEEEWDLDSGDVKEYAYRQGWISPDVPFNFAKAYSEMGLKLRAAMPRFQRLNKLLRENRGRITLDTMRMIQRDHFEGESFAPRWSPADGVQVSICMHAMLENASKTAAASHVELTPNQSPIWWHTMTVPCMGIFAPYSLTDDIPPMMQTAGAKYSEDSAWWQFERLQYAIEKDYPRYMKIWRPMADELERRFRQETSEGNIDATKMQRHLEVMLDATRKMLEKIVSDPATSAEPQHQEMNRKAMERAGISLDM